MHIYELCTDPCNCAFFFLLLFCRMMKATAWFCPVLLTLLCATRLVCTAQRGAVGAGGAAGGSGAAAGGAEVGGSGRTNGYPLDYPDGTRNSQVGMGMGMGIVLAIGVHFFLAVSLCE